MNAVNSAAVDKMDRIYKHQRLIYDVTRRHYLAGRIRMLKGLQPPPGGSVLEVGCGTAWNLIRTASLYPTAKLYGFDISTQMLETARRSIAKNGLADRVTVTHGDATSFDGQALFGVPAFDRIFISYALSMIPDWPKVLDEAARHLKPGGSIHVIDFGQSDRLPATFRAGLFRWLGKFSVTPHRDLKERIAETAKRHGLGVDAADLYRGYATHAVMRKA